MRTACAWGKLRKNKKAKLLNKKMKLGLRNLEGIFYENLNKEVKNEK